MTIRFLLGALAATALATAAFAADTVAPLGRASLPATQMQFVFDEDGYALWSDAEAANTHPLAGRKKSITLDTSTADGQGDDWRNEWVIHGSHTYTSGPPGPLCLPIICASVTTSFDFKVTELVIDQSSFVPSFRVSGIYDLGCNSEPHEAFDDGTAQSSFLTLLRWRSALKLCIDAYGGKQSRGAVRGVGKLLRAYVQLERRAPQRYAIDQDLFNWAQQLDALPVCPGRADACNDLHFAYREAQVVDAALITPLGEIVANADPAGWTVRRRIAAIKTLQAATDARARCSTSEIAKYHTCEGLFGNAWLTEFDSDAGGYKRFLCAPRGQPNEDEVFSYCP